MVSIIFILATLTCLGSLFDKRLVLSSIFYMYANMTGIIIIILRATACHIHITN